MQLEHRSLLIQTIPKVVPAAIDFKNLIKSLHETLWDDVVPISATYPTAIGLVLDAADAAHLLRRLVEELMRRTGQAVELTAIAAELARDEGRPTSSNPFDEVLLDGERPFVNRRPLRNALQRLVTPTGSRLLLVGGGPQSGKSFSFYLLSHAASRRGFDVSPFAVAHLQKPEELAEEMLRRIGAVCELPRQGTESAERWAEKLACVVKIAIEAQGKQRFFVFDDFPEAPPPETLSFIVRLAMYSDQELRGLLRIALVGFPGQLPPDLDDVAVRDEAQPFTTTDMVAVIMQLANARKWSISASAVKDRIDAFESQQPRSLRDRFRFLRSFILQLVTASTGQPP
jgi:hypothetical protein